MRILIVEDEDQIAALLTDVLETEGFVCERPTTELTALAERIGARARSVQR